MSDKFQNKYRIPSARLQNWDYGSNAAYFITICTKNRECFFGEIVDGKMILSDIGQIANQYLNEIPIHFTFVELGEFMVMPNHVHAIIVINKINVDDVNTPKLGVFTIPPIVGDTIDTPNLGVSTIQPTRTTAASEKWKPATLGVIINQYKRICTINARKIHADFEWQSRFHDHIIRNDESFERISEYIRNNPLNWTGDKFAQKIP